MAFTDHHHRLRDGLRLYYRDYGDPDARKVPVLCLSGLTRNSRDYEDLAPHIAAQGRRVLCSDYRGYGQSDRDPEWMHYQIEYDAADAIDLLDGLVIPAVHIVGTSRGGLIAMMLADSHPDRIAGAVINDVGPDVIHGGASKIGKFFDQPHDFPDWASATAAYEKWSGPATPDLSAEGWARRARQTFTETPDGRVAYDFDPALGKAYRARSNTPVGWEKFRAFGTRPVLVIRGQFSGLLTRASFERMPEELPQVQRVTVPERGHVPLLDEPEALAAIDDFFAKAP